MATQAEFPLPRRTNMTHRPTRSRNVATLIVTHDLGGLHRLFDANRLRLGLYLFLGILVFASLLLAFALHYRVTPEVFGAAARSLHWQPAALGGALLISAGWMLTRAGQAGHRGAVGAILMAWSLGLAFLALRVWEGYLEYGDGLLPLTQPFGYPGPRPLDALLFFHFHHLLVIAHAAFVIIAMLTVLPALGTRDPDRRAARLRLAGGYWALVEIAWLASFTAVYLIGHAP
ncbi:hypothetical protein ACLD0W_17535 [Alloalcanivorax sp. C16-1]|uniref:hypothetical protein n=1 Tax=Alloalcanivorax sp. C16-1 TaxID=3390051 RepID=UPI003970E341